MTTNNDFTAILRVVDANLNRLKEGVRVVEDICRFVYEFKDEACKLKAIRHEARSSSLLEALKYRDSVGDALRPTTKAETQREDITSLVIANFKRAQESARTLEETLKIINTDEAELFKQLRYRLYDIEKSFFLKLHQ
ncbi:MAG TPA: thiamine-phosphate pyrophosphorylase [Campylobacterales bacterium]|nr:thiamine-phosphate pyrophosphorylase [Campylobacterales bacterium]